MYSRPVVVSTVLIAMQPAQRRARCVCRQQLDEVRRLRQGERVGVAAALPEAVSTRRRALAERRALLAGGSGGEGSSSTGEDDDALLAVDWRARR